MRPGTVPSAGMSSCVQAAVSLLFISVECFSLPGVFSIGVYAKNRLSASFVRAYIHGLAASNVDLM